LYLGAELASDATDDMARSKMMRDHTPRQAQREADKLFKKVESKKAVTDYARAQQDLHENRERLRAERLAREAKTRIPPK
jgi:hypothetical protein